MEKSYFKIKSGQGMFEDITQPNGIIVGRQIVKLAKTARVEDFVRAGGLVELLEESKEVQAYLTAQAENKSDDSVDQLKNGITNARTAINKYESKSNKALMDEIDSRNADRSDEDKISYNDKSNKAQLIGLLAEDDAKQAKS